MNKVITVRLSNTPLKLNLETQEVTIQNLHGWCDFTQHELDLINDCGGMNAMVTFSCIGPSDSTSCRFQMTSVSP